MVRIIVYAHNRSQEDDLVAHFSSLDMNYGCTSIILWSLGELLNSLRYSLFDETIVVIFVRDSAMLLDIIDEVAIMKRFKLLILLPNDDQELLRLGHRLYPRFMTVKDGGYTEIKEVLSTMIQNIMKSGLTKEGKCNDTQ